VEAVRENWDERRYGASHGEPPRALIIEEAANERSALADLVQRAGLQSFKAATIAEARVIARRQRPDLIVADWRVSDGSSLELLDELEDPEPPHMIVVTADATVGSAVEALRRGVADYFTRPCEEEHLRALLAKVARTIKFEREVMRLRDELRRLGHVGEMVGRSKPMQAIYDLLSRVARTEATVLFIGESGTGKDLAARTLHDLSRRADGPFLPVNCGAIAGNLIESELFGHERGSFTGADRTHRGYFERASGGTLFLDEITETPIELQVKLLRALETSTILRVGGEAPVPIDVRVVAATNQDPEEAVRDGKLRPDLFFRLNVFAPLLAPLRERGHDKLLLAEHFLAQLNDRAGTDKHLSVETLRVLQRYPWPGNVRELKNVIEHAFILAKDEIEVDCLPANVRENATPLLDAKTTERDEPCVRIQVGTSVAEAEKRLIEATLDHFSGERERTARVLGLSVKTLYNRLRSYRGNKDHRG